MMSLADPLALLETLRSHPAETEWFEFKLSRFNENEIGEYVSALANSAMLHDKSYAYLVFGIADGSHEVLGTTLRLKTQKIGEDIFEHWLSRMLSPKINLHIEELDIDDKHIEIVCIEPAYYRPIRFKNVAYIRVNSVKKKLDEYPEKERALWMATSRYSFEEGVAAAHLLPEDIDRLFLWQELAHLLYQRRMVLDQAIEAFIQEGLLLDDQQGGLDATNLFALAAAKRLQDFKSVHSGSIPDAASNSHFLYFCWQVPLHWPRIASALPRKTASHGLPADRLVYIHVQHINELRIAGPWTNIEAQEWL